MTPAEKLYTLKKAEGLTYRQMADASGVSFNRMGPICRGEVRIYEHEITAICNECFTLHTSDFYADMVEAVDIGLPKNTDFQSTFRGEDGKTRKLSIARI